MHYPDKAGGLATDLFTLTISKCPIELPVERHVLSDGFQGLSVIDWKALAMNPAIIAPAQ